MRTIRSLTLVVIAIYSLSFVLVGRGLNVQACVQIDHWLDEQVTRFVIDFKKTENGRVFLKSHTEDGLRKSLVFLQCPKEHFRAIQSLPDLCANIWAIQIFFFTIKEGSREPELKDFFQFMRDNFEKADTQSIPILTHLILVCDTGVLGESLAERYSRLFEFQYDELLRDLKQREDWRNVVRSVMAGDWRAFSAGLSKLGCSEFELELKNYVASLIKPN